jgi:hypothetical protein
MKPSVYCKLFNKSLLSFLLLFVSFTVLAQKTSHRIENQIFASRLGIADNFAYTINIRSFEMSAGTGFDFLNLIQSAFYSPNLNLKFNYILLQKSNIQIGVDLDYLFQWRIHLHNLSSNAHSLFYGYQLLVGKQWKFTQQTAIGGILLKEMPHEFRLHTNFYFSIGVAYAFR